MSETIINVHGNHAAIVPSNAQTQYDFGVVDERERIIAIIENRKGWYGVSLDNLIKEIKGEL